MDINSTVLSNISQNIINETAINNRLKREKYIIEEKLNASTKKLKLLNRQKKAYTELQKKADITNAVISADGIEITYIGKRDRNKGTMILKGVDNADS